MCTRERYIYFFPKFHYFVEITILNDFAGCEYEGSILKNKERFTPNPEEPCLQCECIVSILFIFCCLIKKK